MSERLEKSKPKSRGFRVFTRSCGQTYVRLVNRVPGVLSLSHVKANHLKIGHTYISAKDA